MEMKVAVIPIRNELASFLLVTTLDYAKLQFALNLIPILLYVTSYLGGKSRSVCPKMFVHFLM